MKNFNFFYGGHMKKYLTLLIILFLSSNLINAQWYNQSSGVYENLYGTFFIDQNTGWIVGANGRILKTTNSGVSWIPKSSGTNYALTFIKFFDSNNGIIAGDGGVIKKSTDGGNSWYDVSSGVYIRIQEGFFVNTNVGWLVGNFGLVLKTTDGGSSWQSSFTGPFNNYWVYFLDVNIGWVCGEMGEVRKTTDGGNSWELKAQIGQITLWGMHFVNENVGWFVGEYGTIGKTTNGGETWFGQFSSTVVNLRSVFFSNTEFGWVVGKDETRLRTSNGGITWILEHTGDDYEYLNIYFFDNSKGWIIGTPGYLSGNQSVILFTDNGGLPVELKTFNYEFQNGDIILNWSTATEINNWGFEIERRSLEDDWRTIAFVNGKGTSTELQEYSYTDDLFGVQPGLYFYRLKQIDYSGSYEYSEELEINVPLKDFSLFQNYPNPFNPITKIKYSIPESGHVSLIVTDILGKEVSKLVDEIIEPGYYETEFNGEKLSSGLYFYTLSSEKNSTTRKMLLMK